MIDAVTTTCPRCKAEYTLPAGDWRWESAGSTAPMLIIAGDGTVIHDCSRPAARRGVAVIVPWREGCPHRVDALHWMIGRFCDTHPDWPLVLGLDPHDAPFSRAYGIINGAYKTDADVLVVSDGDVWCDGLDEAVAQVEAGAPWAVPHRLIHRLSRESTWWLLNSLNGDCDWRGLALSDDNAQDRKPYKGNETGTLLVIRRDVLLDVPPDPRFVGWGQEDQAWAIALRTLVGPPWRGDADLVHLWHPAPARVNRIVGSSAGQALHRRYVHASGKPRALRTLLDEAAEVTA